MNTHAQSSVAKRILVLLIATGAFAFSACGSEDATPEVAQPARHSGYGDGAHDPQADEPDVPAVQRPRDGESVVAPRLMGGEPTAPTV